MWPALHALVPALPAPAPDAMDRPELEPLTVTCCIERRAPPASSSTLGEQSEPPPQTNGNGMGSHDEEGKEDDDVPAFYLKPVGARNGAPRPFYARLLANERLTPPEWFQETRHYTWDVAGLEGPLSVEGEGVYRAGDVAYVYPENPPEGVAACLALLGLEGGDVLVLSPVVEEEGAGAGGMDLPGRCTAGRLLRR